MAYIYEMPVSNGIAITLSTEHDLEQEVFNVGDSIVFDCTIKNTNTLASSASDSLIYNNTLKSVEFAIKSPAQPSSDDPLSTSVLYSGTLRPIVGGIGGGEVQRTKTLTITLNQCQYNKTVGGIAKIRLGIKTTMQTGRTDMYRFGATVSINDPTVAPSYAGFSPTDVIDINGYKDRFGYLIQERSIARLRIPADKIDKGTDEAPSGSVSSVRFSITTPDGTKYGSTDSYPNDGMFESGVVNTKIPGDYLCELSITGAYGKTSTTSTTFAVLPYAPPSLSLNGTSPVAKRFRAEQDDYGATVYTEAPDGKNILTSFIGGIQAFNGLNTFNISAKYGIDGADTMTDVGIVASGTDADSILYGYQDTIGFLPVNAFSVDNRYQVDITLTDYFGNSATITGYVEKAVFRFRVTENGVAVGMNTTGTAKHKKFEVAETHESFFHGGIAGVTNYPDPGVEKPTGGTWVNRNGDRVPVYWQVLVYNLTTTGSTQNGPTIADFDELVSITGRFFRSADGYYHQLNFYASSSDMNYAYMRNDGVLRVRSTDKAVVTAIVEYTKK